MAARACAQARTVVFVCLTLTSLRIPGSNAGLRHAVTGTIAVQAGVERGQCRGGHVCATVACGHVMNASNNKQQHSAPMRIRYLD